MDRDEPNQYWFHEDNIMDGICELLIKQIYNSYLHKYHQNGLLT